MSFTAPLFTNVGKQLHARALSGDCAIKFTGIALGNGDLTTQAIAALTGLISEQMRIELDIYQRIDHETVNVRATFNNSELSAGFFWKEVGLYAQNPDDPDNRDADILYCYQNAGDLAEYIPSIDSQVMEKTISITTKISDTAEVTAILKSEVYASKEAFEAYQEEADQTFVHLTGAETIAGKKSFKNTVEFKTQAPSVYLVDEFFSKEDEELPFKNSEARVVFQDADNNNTAMVISSFTSDGTQKLILRAYNPNGTTYTEMALCYPPDGGAPYATAPTTAEEVPGSHIATTKYVNARYLRMDGSNAMAADLNMGGNSLADVLGIELRPGANAGHGGFIDFHFNGSADDHTARIMEDAKGHITILAPNGINLDGRLSTVAGLSVRAQDGATEGGEILLLAPGGSYTHRTIIDNQGNATRIYSKDANNNVGARLDLKHDTGQAFWNGNELITGAGGTMLGEIVNAVGDIIRQNATDKWTSVKGGTSNATGGYFTTYGKDHSNKGASVMGASNGVTESTLVLSADGYLKLNSNRVPTLRNPFVPDYSAGVAISSGYVTPSSGVVIIQTAGSAEIATTLWVNGVNVGFHKTTSDMDSTVNAWVNKNSTITFSVGGSAPSAYFFPLAVGG